MACVALIRGHSFIGCEDNLWEIVCFESFDGVIIMVNPSFELECGPSYLEWPMFPLFVVLGHLRCEDNLSEIMCPKSFSGVKFALGALLQG